MKEEGFWTGFLNKAGFANDDITSKNNYGRTNGSSFLGRIGEMSTGPQDFTNLEESSWVSSQNKKFILRLHTELLKPQESQTILGEFKQLFDVGEAGAEQVGEEGKEGAKQGTWREEARQVQQGR